VCLQFSRLERVDIGGNRGRLLTSNVRIIHADFQRAIERFHQVGHSKPEATSNSCHSSWLVTAAGLSQLLACHSCWLVSAVEKSVPVQKPSTSDSTCMVPVPVLCQQQVEYDVLDIDEPRFVEDYAQFQRVVQDLERRLASVIIQVRRAAAGGHVTLLQHAVAQMSGLLPVQIQAFCSPAALLVVCTARPSSTETVHVPTLLFALSALLGLQGFDECTTVGTSFKLFESFEGLVERDAISADLERKHAELVRSFLFELHEARLKQMLPVPAPLPACPRACLFTFITSDTCLLLKSAFPYIFCNTAAGGRHFCCTEEQPGGA